MPEWLTLEGTQVSSMVLTQVMLRLSIAAIYGSCVAVIYRLSHGKQEGHQQAWTLTTTLVLLSMLIAMVSMVIGESVARAFSLVGALSIVRFRTVVEDTRDTAFVIFAVIVGMAAGAGLFLVPLFGIPAIGAIAVVLSRASRSVPPTDPDAHELELSIRLGLGHDPNRLLVDSLRHNLQSYRQISANTGRKGAVLDLVYRVRLRPESDMNSLVTELNRIEGVQDVDLRV